MADAHETFGNPFSVAIEAAHLVGSALGDTATWVVRGIFRRHRMLTASREQAFFPHTREHWQTLQQLREFGSMPVEAFFEEPPHAD